MQATSVADVKDANLVGTSGTLSRGSTAASSAGANSFRTVGFQNNGISTANTDYFQTEVAASPGFKVSLSTLDAKFNGTLAYAAAPGVSNQFAYSLDGTNFTLIGTPTVTTLQPVTMPQIDLSGVTALQNVTAGTTITLRYYASGQTPTGGWGFNSAAAGTYGFEIGGTVTTAGVDTTAPVIAPPLAPANGATGVALNSNLVVTFDENITGIAGGVITLKAGAATVESFTLPSAAVGISGKVVTINPTADLAPSTLYHVEIDGVAIEDLVGNNFAGYTGSGTWSFTSTGPDVAGPAVETVTPVNDATGVALDVSPEITYDEIVVPVTGGAILIKQGATTVTSLEVTDSGEVLTSNDQVFLTIPSGVLLPNTTYTVEIPAGAFEDILGNDTLLYSWSFTTKALPVLTAITPYTQDFAGFVSLATFPEGWTVSGPDLTYDGDWGTGTTGGFRGGATAGVLGYQHTSSTGVLVETLSLVNGTGSTITDLVIGYTGKRIIGGATPPIERYPTFTVRVGGSEATPIPALAYGRLEGDSSVKLAGVTGLSIAPGAAIVISWTSDRDLLGGGASKQVGIDDVTVSVGTLSSAPTISGPSLTPGSLTSVSAEANAEVTSDGGAAVTAMGFVYSLTSANPAPEIGGTGVTDLPFTPAGVSTFLSPISGLTADSSYTVRAYATNTVGTAYTPVLVFSTLPTPPSFTGLYSQPFDNFVGTLPAGWSMVSGGSTTYGGIWDVAASSSASTRGGVSNPGVLGYQHTSTSGTFTATLTLVNNTGSVLDELNIAYLGRAGRVGEEDVNRFPIWEVKLNGGDPIEDLAYSTEAGTNQTKVTTITGLTIPNGSSFTISWSSTRGEGLGSARLIGLGEVIVSTEPIEVGSYDSWAVANGIDGIASSVDSDNDGLINLLEYAFGFDPLAGNGAAGTITGNTISFPKGADAVANGDVSYQLQTSATMAAGSWIDADASAEDDDSISYTWTPGTPGKLFVRLVVE
ncbi:Ig-like domain-containing protein [Luteolibacter sp. Populi]|uniref:Ig-like domain-containing protein n=1 Tax=Luteolibacter sp. Populi TaxID=3230487 RepID=UPI003467C635